jgi:eukaryotic-like serine/threonine-protein kinase
MTPPQSIDRETFLDNLRQSGLLSETELASVAPQLPDTNRGRLIARSLVEQGLLTRFQAERLLAGRTAGFLLGQYKILDQLGRGGMGRVFKAEHQTMKRVVALKVLAPEVMESDRAKDLFLREVRVVGKLAHPNIVTAFDANEVQGRYFLVLEYVDGPNLEQLVRKQGTLSVGLACDYISQVAMGLQCAHGLGMVHRDVKPANLLVQRRGFSDDSPGLVKISDFGLARLQAPPGNPSASQVVGTILTREHAVMGTPDYLSPEQARNLHTTDIRSDIYSLGCTFYFLLTGQVPFPGGKTMDKLVRHSSEQPAAIRQFRSDVPPAVLDVLNRMMAKRPADRYQTPAELAAALEPYAVSGPIPWAPSPPAPALPPDGPSSSGEPVLDSTDDLSALINTVPTGNSLTPLETHSFQAREPQNKLGNRRNERPERWFWVIIAVIGTLTVGVGVIALLLGNLWQ